MDKIDKQLRDVLGSDVVNKLEELAQSTMPKDIEERLAEASKDAGPADMVLVVPPGPSRIGRMPDLGRGMNKPIMVVPLERNDREISESMKELLKELGPPIAIDCQMNPDGSLSFGVVPPDTDHPALKPIQKTSLVSRLVLKPNQPQSEGGPKVDIMEVASYADKPKAFDPSMFPHAKKKEGE